LTTVTALNAVSMPYVPVFLVLSVVCESWLFCLNKMLFLSNITIDAYIIFIVVKLFVWTFSVSSAVQVDEDDPPDVVWSKCSPCSSNRRIHCMDGGHCIYSPISGNYSVHSQFFLYCWQSQIMHFVEMYDGHYQRICSLKSLQSYILSLFIVCNWWETRSTLLLCH